MSIQRFETFSGSRHCVDGDYVKYSDHVKRIEELDGDNKFIQSQYKMTVEKNDKLQEQVDAFENVKEAFCDFLNKK